ncbi:MAG: hypothetical protein HC905_28545 [Bacteroidales bacterium]|nr:hypothetical protein [Bacteroidales bacterium]
MDPDYMQEQKNMLDQISFYKNENIRLQAELTALQEEHSLVVVTVIKTLQSVELWPIKEGDNLTSKAIKGVKTIMFESAVNPTKLANRFNFIKDIIPLCEKYKNIQV